MACSGMGTNRVLVVDICLTLGRYSERTMAGTVTSLRIIGDDDCRDEALEDQRFEGLANDDWSRRR